MTRCLWLVPIALVCLLVSPGRSVELDSGLVAYWGFDEGVGSVAHDGSGAGHDGNVTGPKWEVGVAVGALDFNQVPERVDFPSPVCNTPPYTVCCWLLPDFDADTTRCVLSNIATWDSQQGFIILVLKDWNVFRFSCYDSGIGGHASAPYESGEWVFLCASWDGTGGYGKVKLYLNGQFAGGGNTSEFTVGTGGNLRIGSPTSTTVEAGWRGKIDEVRIYNRILDSTEISQLYQLDPPRGKILVWCAQTFEDYNRTVFNSGLPIELARDGWAVTVEDLGSIPDITLPLLEQYDQFWMMSAEDDPVLSPTEISAILDYHARGHGIMIAGDSYNYNVPANQVSTHWGISIDGEIAHCGLNPFCSASTDPFVPHELWEGVATLQVNENEGDIATTGEATIIASHAGADMIAVLDTDSGRVAWDASFYRFYDHNMDEWLSIYSDNNPQYARNLAKWLANEKCGDADGSNAVDIDDVVYLVNYIFAGGPEPVPYESGDADCSGAIDIDDVVYLVTYIFSGGNAPCDTDGDGEPDC